LKKLQYRKKILIHNFIMEEEYNIDVSDTYSLEEDEDSTETLLREIEEDEAREASLREAAIAEALAGGKPLETGAQITDFQEKIITTGSGVGRAMVVLLIIAFIVKTIEICYNYLTRKRALLRIKTAISKTRSRSVDEYNPAKPDFSRMEYVEYNAEFTTAMLMDEKIREGKNEKRVLLQMLHQRTLELMHRRTMLIQNEQYVTRAYNMNVLPLEV